MYVFHTRVCLRDGSLQTTIEIKVVKDVLMSLSISAEPEPTSKGTRDINHMNIFITLAIVAMTANVLDRLCSL